MEPVTISGAIAAAAAEVMVAIEEIGAALSMVQKCPDASQLMNAQRNRNIK